MVSPCIFCSTNISRGFRKESQIPIIINALKEVLYNSLALVLKSKDENDHSVLRFQEMTTMVKAYIEIVNNDIEKNKLAANKVSSQWDENIRIHFVTDTQDVDEQQKSDVAVGITIDKKQKDPEEGFRLVRDSPIIDYN